ncbi:MAG: SIMPL domain-containing protein [Acidobacteriaceae bacterium]|nr:SIMPL domain-containing protein [Acidobacteriaceae bacterium]
MRLFCLLLLAIAVSAQEAANNTPLHTVRASGEAVVFARPDRAEVNLAVSDQAPTAQAAAAANAKSTQQVLDAMKPLVYSSGQVRTAGYTLNPDYEYPQGGGTPKLIGYRATNSILVTIDDLNNVGKVIDTAVQSGATNVNGVSFTVRSDDTYRAQALAEAAQKARASAEAIADALNVHVIGLLDAQSTTASPPRPLLMAKTQALAAEPATPINPGAIEVHASVTVTLQVEAAPSQANVSP